MGLLDTFSAVEDKILLEQTRQAIVAMLDRQLAANPTAHDLIQMKAIVLGIDLGTHPEHNTRH